MKVTSPFVANATPPKKNLQNPRNQSAAHSMELTMNEAVFFMDPVSESRKEAVQKNVACT
jgi:hypothetical protein